MTAIARVILILIFTAHFANSLSQENCRLLVWSDEFDYSGLPDTLKWGYDVGDGCDYGICNWGNLEAQYYTYRDLNNARVENGSLIIEARKELTVNKKYSSARLVTRDLMKLTYGRIEYRAKLAGGKGTWSALWILGDREELGWPDCGEIDVVEYVGAEPGIARGTAHQASGYAGAGPSMSILVPDAETVFHTYAIEWNSDSIVWFMDDQKYHVYYNEHTGEAQWPYDRSFYLLMNLAVGGTLGGPIDNAIFDTPVTVEIDYVRVYQTASEAGIQGKSVISRNEGNLVYFSPIPADKYTWSFPGGVAVVSGEGTSSVTVDWGCVEGSVTLEVESSCDTVSIDLPVTFGATEIEGKPAVYQGENAILYAVPIISGGTYAWSVPADAAIVGDANGKEILVNWGCSAGQVSVDIKGTCSEETVTRDIAIVPLGLTGPGYLSAGSRDHEFYTDSLHAGSYRWIVPEGVVINSGSDSHRINLDWGNIAGFVKVEVTNSCGVMEDSMLVNITSNLIIADFDVVDPVFQTFGGSNIEKADNPFRLGWNTSDLVGITYKGPTAASWGGFFTDLAEPMDFSYGSTFGMVVYAPRTGNVLFKIESSSGVAAPIEVSTPITTTGEWEKLFFIFEGAESNAFDRIALFFDFGQVFTDTFYFDDVALLRSHTVADLTLSQDGEITEGSEDGMVIHVDLHGDIFVESLQMTNWIFENLPEGVEAGTLNRLGDTEAELVLSGNTSVDYDEDITDFRVTVAMEELVHSDFPLSVDTGIVFTAVIENKTVERPSGTVRIYPNPAGDQLSIETGPGTAGKKKGRLVDMKGTVLMTFTMDGQLFTLDMSACRAGSYLLLLEDGSGVERILVIYAPR